MTLTDVFRDEKGHPRAFRAHRHELKIALDGIPDRVLLAAFKRAWKGKPPRYTAKSLRRRILAAHRARRHQGSSATRLMPLLDAAKELGVSSRTLRRQIEDGELEPHYLGRHGRRILAIELGAEPETWSLIPGILRPDPRLRPSD